MYYLLEKQRLGTKELEEKGFSRCNKDEECAGLDRLGRIWSSYLPGP